MPETQLRPEDAEAVARDIDFCMEAGDFDTARKQLGRLIELLSRVTHPNPSNVTTRPNAC